MNTLNRLQMTVASQPNTSNGAAGYAFNRVMTVVPPYSWMHPTTPSTQSIETTLARRLTQTIPLPIKPTQYMRAAAKTTYSPALPLSWRRNTSPSPAQAKGSVTKAELAKTITAVPATPRIPIDPLFNNKTGRSVLTRSASFPAVSSDRKKARIPKKDWRPLPPLPARDTPKTSQGRTPAKKPSLSPAKTIAKPLHSESATTGITKHQTATRNLPTRPLPPLPSSPSPKARPQPSLSVSDAKPDGSVGAAGHADSFIFLGSSVIGKLTLNNEADVYINRKKYGLDNIIPKHRLESQLSGAEKRAVRQRLGMNKPGYQVIAMERVGGNIKQENKRELDIKIGSATASARQTKESQPAMNAALKKIRHKSIDWFTGSRWRHFRLEGAKLKENKLAMSNLLLSRSTEKNLEVLLTLPEKKREKNFQKINDKLKEIRQTMSTSDICFIGSSILIVIDDKNPANTMVKLIDLAHPVHKREGSQYFKKVQDRFIVGIESLQKEIKTIEMALNSPTPKS
ncbi:inositol polyphosphate kinase family protein [Candidatus Sororendozoicomonas aggregata]|uniref:inositol polyphosphate kinase family protein n=1 Tax=Candidatus Sororendozoicomonas aggregata TaxID=3073239 RepID=UPI002ED48C33